VYQLTYINVSYSAFLISIALPVIDGLFSGFCIYLSGQFDIVAGKIENLIDWDDSVITFTNHQNQEIKNRLRKVIERHNQCIEITKDMVRYFSQIIFGQFVFTALLLALASVSLILANNWVEQVMYANCLLTSTVLLFLYCKSGSLIPKSVSTISLPRPISWKQSRRKINKIKFPEQVGT
jgi:7tm Odorant receptor